MNPAEEIQKLISGTVATDDASIKRCSKDASLLVVRPSIVVAPKNVEDIKMLVRYVSERKKENPTLSLTARSAGTDMSGGPLTESIVVDMTPHFQGVIRIQKDALLGVVLPGTYYRDFEKITLSSGLLMPSYTASRELCTVGGMVANNAGGEKTLQYGKVEQFVHSLKVVFSDGNEYEVKPLSRVELEQKMSEKTFEGQLYRSVYNLVTSHAEELKNAKPNVSKNSAGYYLWNVWDGQTFDLTKVIVGSQGTLGLVTEITFRLVPVKKYSRLLVIFLRDLAPLAGITNTLLSFRPESLEVYDDNTLKLALKFFPDLLRILKPKNLFKLIWSFWPEALMMLRGGLPKIVLLAEVAGNEASEIEKQLQQMHDAISKYHRPMRITKTTEETSKYWTIRRESFNLLRKHVHGRRTAPFIDDIIVRPEALPEFLPKLRTILDQYKLYYTINGHDGNGNLHIIPLMDMTDPKNRDVVIKVSEKVYSLVLEFKGSITAEHNDGLIRTPFLEKMYGKSITALFAELKKIFDPECIFNPGKKVPIPGGAGTILYAKDHISEVA